MSRSVTRSLLLCVLTFAWAGLAYAQQTVRGTVTDASTGVPLPGVNIVVQGTTTGTTTGLDGTYSLTVPGSDAVLVFSFVGYVPQQVTIGDQEVIDVALAEDVALLEDIVVVGYGTQRKEDVTGSVSTIDADDANLGLVTSPDQLIQGRVPGVNIVANNGEPGAGFNIRIRGGTSISASNEPLYVIDGVPIDNSEIIPGGEGVSGAAAAPGRNPLNLINPNDIESITILKDASATAIYGSRGANGVILIETKQGVPDRLTVDYEGYVAASQPYRTLDVLSGSEYRQFVQQMVNQGELDQNALEALGNANTDWEDEVTQTGVSQFHNLAFAGGTDNTQYRASVSYMDQEGVLISSGLERLTGRINADHQAFDGRLRLGLNLTSAYTNDDFTPYENTGGFEGGLLTNTFSYNPTFPVTNGDGTFFETGTGRQSLRNPVALAEQIQDFAKTTRTLGNISAELDLVEGLTAQLNVGADRQQASRRQYFPKQSPAGAEFGGRAIQRNRERTSLTFQSYLTYNATLALDHNLNLLGGYEFNEYIFEEVSVGGDGFISDVLGFDAIESAESINQQLTFSNHETSRLISFFTRANYNFREKYYLTGVLRYDGSSRFGSGNRWAVFPSVSVAWRLSEEPFLRSVEALSDLRLKVGYGIVGSQEIPNYRSLALLGADPNNRAVIGERAVTGVSPANYANPDLQWEETRSFNVGIDYGFLNNKFSGTLEYYIKNTDNLLLEVPVPQPAPLPVRLENIGEVKNQGFEFALDALAVDRTDLSLTLGAVFSTNQNEVVSLPGGREIFTGSVSGRGQSGTQSQIITEGKPLGTFYGFVFEGVENGRQVFKDVNGDGQITGDDRTFIGDAQPDFTYGLRANLYWKNFDAALFIRGEQGRDVFNNTALVYQTKSAVLQGQNFLADALDDPDALDEPAVFSSRWIEDGSFLRFENITLGYTFDLTRVTSQARNARVYFSVNNVLLLTGYSGYDPEVNTDAGLATLGIDYTNYPRPRTFTLGVHLGF